MRLLSLSLLCGVLCACQRYVFVEQQFTRTRGTQQEITIALPSESDILFVMDNSGSMSEEIARVRTNIISFINQLRESGNKFRIAFTTTDNREASNCDDVTGLPGGVDPVHNGRCGRFFAPAGSPAWLDGANFATGAEMAAAIGMYLDPSVADVIGSAVEQPIKSAARALSEDLTKAGAPNEGFFRKDALLVIAFVTDESDCSFDDAASSTFVGSPVPGFNCYSQANGLKPVAEWADDIVKLKGGTKGDVRIGLISASIKDESGNFKPSACRITNGLPTDQCACFFLNSLSYCAYTPINTPTVTNMSGTGCGFTGNEGNCCIALANSRMFDFASQFASEVDTICQPDFTETLIRLAILADRQCFNFPEAPLNNDPTNVVLKMRREGAAKDDFKEIPLTDAANPEDGWYYVSGSGSPRACLSGIWKRQGLDTVSIFVLSSDEGPEDAMMSMP